MAHPFGKFPTLREFIDKAVSQGCIEKHGKGALVGYRGAIRPRYLIRQHPSAPAVILPNIADDERLTPTVLSNLVRVLQVVGYEHLIL